MKVKIKSAKNNINSKTIIEYICCPTWFSQHFFKNYILKKFSSLFLIAQKANYLPRHELLLEQIL
jgi:hypothetical protein